MNGKFQGWVVVALLLGTAAYAIAQENITLTTYYPSPRGVYDELRARTFQDFDDPANFFVDPNGSTVLNILTVQGDAILNSPIAGTTTINGFTTINDNLHVTGNFTLDGEVVGDLRINGDLIANVFRDRQDPGNYYLDAAAPAVGGARSLRVAGNVEWGGTVLPPSTVPWDRLVGPFPSCTVTSDGGTAVRSWGATSTDLTCGRPEAVYANPP